MCNISDNLQSCLSHSFSVTPPQVHVEAGMVWHRPVEIWRGVCKATITARRYRNSAVAEYGMKVHLAYEIDALLQQQMHTDRMARLDVAVV